MCAFNEYPFDLHTFDLHYKCVCKQDKYFCLASMSALTVTASTVMFPLWVKIVRYRHTALQALSVTMTPVRVTIQPRWQLVVPKRIFLYWKSSDRVTITCAATLFWFPSTVNVTDRACIGKLELKHQCTDILACSHFLSSSSDHDECPLIIMADLCHGSDRSLPICFGHCRRFHILQTAVRFWRWWEPGCVKKILH